MLCKNKYCGDPQDVQKDEKCSYCGTAYGETTPPKPPAKIKDKK